MTNSAYKVSWAIAAVIAIAYTVVLLQFAPPALQDYPNHLARCVVMNDLLFHHGAQFGEVFQYDFMVAPYILHDLILASLIELFGVKIAASLWGALIVLALPASMLLYTRIAKIRREDQILAFILSLFLSTNCFFFRGFLAFSLAVPTLIVALAWARSLRQNFSLGIYALYCAAIGLSYLVHLTALIFATAAIAVSAALKILLRTARLRTEALISLPIGLLLIWHFVLRPPVSGVVPPSDQYYWGTIIGKIQNLEWSFIRFNRFADLAMLALFILCIAWQARHLRFRQVLATPYALEMFALVFTFLGIYIVLPLNLATASWVDVRALPMLAIFIIMACLIQDGSERLPMRAWASAAGLSLAAILAIGNLTYIFVHLHRLDEWLTEYRAVVAKIPERASVLPVYTNKRDRPIKSTLHAAALAVIDRDALNPYLFSKDWGNPMQYFSYRRKPYAPDEVWYVEPTTDAVDWQTIALSYQFLLVMKPFDPERIQVQTTSVFENGAAALLAISTSKVSANLTRLGPR